MVSSGLRGLGEALVNLRICARSTGAAIVAASSSGAALPCNRLFRRCMTTETFFRDPLAEQSLAKLPPLAAAVEPVPLTIHRFPSLEPVRLELWSKKHIDVPFRRDLLHLAVVYEGDCSRGVSTVRVKNRWEVKGSGRKIRPQKGMGMARVGDRYSPLFRGGGKTFGPRPKDWSTKMNRKQYDLAWRVALSHRYRSGELVVVDNELDFRTSAEFAEARPGLQQTLVEQYLAKHAAQMIKRMGFAEGKTLFITMERRDAFFEAMGFAEKWGRALDVSDVDVKDLLGARRIVIERPALAHIVQYRQNDLRSDVRYIDGSRRMPPELGEPLQAIGRAVEGPVV